ncbi:MAG: SUKH-4 family immunity protein [Micropruina sp.]|uniref:SUKH-4 family immunity protein n=1 Tax=Micropruina sp. TaxID=2737536 RepID=UPI0039E421CB
MIDPTEAARAWENPLRTPAGPVGKLGLIGGAADVLVGVGLPVSAEPLFAAVRPRPITSGPGAGTIQVGTDFGSLICVRPPDGEVLSVRADGGPVRRVNADLASFAEFLALTSGVLARFAQLDDDQIDRSVATLRQQLLRLDPSAFADPDDWWALIFEQLSDGLL